MNAQDRYNNERYTDMTCFLALRNIERKERRSRMKENWIYRRGDVYLANLDPYIGSEQGGTRPVVVLQNDVGNRYAPTLIVATVTSRTEKKKYQPTHVLIAHNTAFEKPSVVQLEQIFTIDKSRVQRFLGRLTQDEMQEIEKGVVSSLDLNELFFKIKTVSI